MKNIRKFVQFLNENHNYPWAGNLKEEDFARLYHDDNFHSWLNFIYEGGIRDPYTEIASYIEQKLDLEGDTWVSGARLDDRNRRIFQTWFFNLGRHDFIDIFGDPYYWTDEKVCIFGEGLWLDENDHQMGTDPDFVGCSWFVNINGVLCHIFIDRQGISFRLKISESLQGTTQGHEIVINVFKGLFDLYVRKADWEKIFK